MFIILLLTILPYNDDILRDNVTCIEYNEFCDDQARLIFNQYIFWDENDNVQAWRLVKKGNEIRYDYSRRCYTLRFIDGESIREVRALTKMERITQYDPELVNRDKLPKERRKGLSSSIKIIERSVLKK